LAVLLLGRPAAAGPVVRGARAAEIDARDVDDGRAVSLHDHRGRALLLAFVGTACPHCQRLVPRLDDIAARHAAAGLDVLVVTPDARTDALAFRRDRHLLPRLALVPPDTLRAYAVDAYPLGVLVAPDGRVLFRGDPARLTDRVLKVYLSRVRILPRAPPAFVAQAAALRAGRYGAVGRDLERLRACPGLDVADCRFVRDALAWIAWQRQGAWAHASEDERRGRWAMAWETYGEIESAHAGTEDAARAARARAALAADPARARAIRADLALERARRAGRWQPAKTAAALLRVVVHEHPGSEAAAEAARLIAVLSR
jgi:thiol-disulfide isomerase/thioredoxin